MNLEYLFFGGWSTWENVGRPGDIYSSGFYIRPEPKEWPKRPYEFKLFPEACSGNKFEYNSLQTELL